MKSQEWLSQTNSYKVFSEFLYTGNDEAGNTGTVEIMEKRIMGKLKEEEIIRLHIISLSLALPLDLQSCSASSGSALTSRVLLQES